jgi:DnaJ-class molecular chaperone
MSEQDVLYEIRATLRCSTCSGEGRLNESQTQCPTCHGQGKIYRWVPAQQAIAAIMIPPVKL